MTNYVRDVACSVENCNTPPRTYCDTACRKISDTFAVATQNVPRNQATKKASQYLATAKEAFVNDAVFNDDSCGISSVAKMDFVYKSVWKRKTFTVSMKVCCGDDRLFRDDELDNRRLGTNGYAR